MFVTDFLPSLYRRAAAIAAVVMSVAADPAAADIEFHGFGQVLGGTTLDNTHTLVQPANLTYAADPSFSSESLFALQADTQLDPRIHVTAQFVARGKSDFQPKVEMAFATFDLGDDWQLRGGRQRLPLYMFSAYQSVGQSYVWARLPPTVYFEPFENFDGLDLFRTFNLGKGWSVTTQTIYGEVNSAFQVTRDTGTYDATLEGKNLFGSSFDANYRALLHLRAEYFFATTTVTSPQLDQLLGLFRALGLNQAATELDTNNDRAMFRGLGIELTPGNWLFSAEYAEGRGYHSATPHIRSAYVMGGYRWGNLTTALTWQHENTAPSYDALNYIPASAACPAPNGQFVPGMCQIYAKSFLDTNKDLDRYYELTFRYDVTDHVALKLDYTAYDSGLLGHPSANLVTTGVTFAF
jgi:hypothetical protein